MQVITSCNLRLNDIVPAEINYSSIVNNVGPSDSWRITFQITKLLEKQQNHFNKICTIEDYANMRSECYKSKFDAELGIENERDKIHMYISSLAH